MHWAPEISGLTQRAYEDISRSTVPGKLRIPSPALLSCGLNFGDLMVLFCGPPKKTTCFDLSNLAILTPKIKPWIFTQTYSRFTITHALQPLQYHVLTYYLIRKLLRSPLTSSYNTTTKVFQARHWF